MENSSLILKQHYRISPLSIQAQQGGWSALAYKVTTVGNLYFLKIHEKSASATTTWTAHIKDYMPILVWLNESTALKGRIPRPVLTIDGSFMVEKSA